jgi:hypothetical protein
MLVDLLNLKKPERQAERIVLSLPLRVEAADAENVVWREITHLESVSDAGAGFYLARPFEIGQLLFLTMPLESDLRRYDHDKEQYSIWGVVRHCHRALKIKTSVYNIGVAFIGQTPPASYLQNPLTIYRLGERGEDGLWQISETTQPAQNRRQKTRYTIPIEVFVAVCDADENILAQEKTVTENISETGASVFSGLQLNIGDRVKVIKQHGNFSAPAIVRNRRVGEDNLPRLHLEFVNVRFPLDGVE